MQTFGKKGEDLACSFLQSHGYEIVVRNFRHKKSEIDVICRKDNLLVFVEVKTRRSVEFGFPEEFVSQNQQKAIIRAAENYVIEHAWKGDIRFDIVAVLINKETTDIEHLKDAFY
ncbi:MULTISPECIES: YraN family protein [Roseivirga]|mgnify:FL=1|jgi:putative endonuclease|uniref:UPF0102 protein GCM10011340_08740 n=1 Tax=Roseivirga thermotolerans TaxID=1758176 RepID=A0ABQ3I701_9BACT|nr:MULTISPECIES: YraN family protein [Roseivirga]MEC7755117.1 YraN family protein [Bacteroidota bacterium]GHE56106.1 UPF0102 protein [Roseivirga thermotolerans]|tara:strand:- start:1011 stop:1355 length:345 start_codon:yes stop_codon:yes gene_type:complete